MVSQRTMMLNTLNQQHTMLNTPKPNENRYAKNRILHHPVNFDKISPASIKEFNAVFNDIKYIEFIKKNKNDSVSIHDIKITTMDNNIEDAQIIKASGNGHRNDKEQKLGAGTFKYVQAAILIRKEKPPTMFALLTLEYNQTMPDEILEELHISNYLKKLKALHQSILIPKYLSIKEGKGHENTNGTKTNLMVKKVLGSMPISESADSLHKKGNTEDKLKFIFGALTTLFEYGNANEFNGDIKPDNLEWNGRVFDHGSTIHVCHYGTPGYHALYQQHEEHNSISLELKQRQDAFAIAASIYHALTGTLLDSNPANGKWKENKYTLPPLDNQHFNQKVLAIHNKIRNAKFPFFDYTNEKVKDILFKLTGTEKNGIYSNGNNLHGKEVENLLQSIVKNSKKTEIKAKKELQQEAIKENHFFHHKLNSWHNQ